MVLIGGYKLPLLVSYVSLVLKVLKLKKQTANIRHDLADELNLGEWEMFCQTIALNQCFSAEQLPSEVALTLDSGG